MNAHFFQNVRQDRASSRAPAGSRLKRLCALLLASSAGMALGAPFAYVPNVADDTLSVIDTASRAVTRIVSVGDAPYGVAVAPDGAHVYVTNLLGNSVSVVSTATNSVVATIPVGGYPYEIVVSPDGKRAYVSQRTTQDVAVIDTATNTVIKVIPVPSPTGLAVTQDSTKVYVASSTSPLPNLYVISAATNTVGSVLGLGSAIPSDLALTLDDSRIYMPTDHQNVQVFSTASNSITGSIFVGFVFRVTASADGNKIFVSGSAGNANTTWVIDTATNAVEATLPISTGNGLSTTPDGGQLYVVNWEANSVTVVDAETYSTLAVIPVGNQPGVNGNFIGPAPSMKFGGFLPPVDPMPVLNAMKAGAAVPVRFRLGGNFGLDVLTRYSPTSSRIDCRRGSAIDAVEQRAVGPGLNKLKYDADSGVYTYVWKTDRDWSGTCRVFKLRLKDGTTQRAFFKFW